MTNITTSNYWSDTNIVGKIHIMEIQEKEEMGCSIVTYIEKYLLPRARLSFWKAAILTLHRKIQYNQKLLRLNPQENINWKKRNKTDALKNTISQNEDEYHVLDHSTIFQYGSSSTFSQASSVRTRTY